MALVLPGSCRENTDSGDDTCQELSDVRCVLEIYMLAEHINVYVDGSLKHLHVQDPGSLFGFLASGLFSLLYQGEKRVKISWSLEGKQAIRQCRFFSLTVLLTPGFSVQLWLSVFSWHVTSTEPRLGYVMWHEMKGDTPEETVAAKSDIRQDSTTYHEGIRSCRNTGSDFQI